MKRFVLLTLVLAMSLSLMACGAEKEPETTAAPIDSTPAPKVEQTEAPQRNYPAIDETVVYDDGTFKLTAKEIDYSGSRSLSIKFLAENNSDHTVSFVSNDFTINGITIWGSFYIKVAPGKKANYNFEIDYDDLAYVGISEIATIVSQDLFLYNTDANETVLHTSFALETSIADGYRQTIDRSGQLLFEKDGISITYRRMETDWMGEPVMAVFIENTSDRNVSIHVEDVSVNGFMVYANLAAASYAGCVKYADIDFSGSDLEENDISDLEEVCFKLWAYDNDANTTLWRSEEITVPVS